MEVIFKRHGVFVWRGDGKYKEVDCIRWFRSEKMAKKYADKENEKDMRNNFVVRPYNYLSEYLFEEKS